MSEIPGKILKYDAGEDWGRSVGPIEWKMKKYYKESRRKGTFFKKERFIAQKVYTACARTILIEDIPLC
jgi:hypothetical protein